MLPDILQEFALELGTEVKNNRLDVPEKFGSGYCTGYVFNKHIRMIISNYVLYENIDIKNPNIDVSEKIIFFKFQNIFSQSNNTVGQQFKLPSVLIATSKINTDEIISLHSNTSTINIEVNADYLKKLLNVSQKSAVVQSLVLNTQPLVFEQLVLPAIKRTVDEMLTENINDSLVLFFMRIKAEELICRLLMELEKRDEKRVYSLNENDVQSLYKIRDEILKNIGTPPLIHELADAANMSSSKFKRLFKQIFGDSVYRYYQGFRMKEAARLLKEDKLSVSEVGYRLGFSNLSHFSRVFEKYNGTTPKKYSLS